MKQLLFTLLLIVIVYSGPYSGPTWQNQPGQTKLSKLNIAVENNTNPADWPGALEKAQLFIESMAPTFDAVGDDFPKQGLFNWDTRKKLIHSVGVIAKVEYVSTENSYTGVFQGSKNAYIRFSVAQEVNTKGGPDAMTPGISLKFLRDNVPSANVFGMYSLVGQSSFNFFAHDLTNHVPELPSDGPTALQLLRIKFLTASDYAVFLGVSSMAVYDEKGNVAPRPAFPFRLQFHPSTVLHNAFPDNYTGEDYETQLIKFIKPDQLLYEVYAQDTPLKDDLTLIGKIYARSAPTSSKFSDESLFFQHTRFEDDLKTYPTWKQPALDIMSKQRNMNMPGYTYPDLPWKDTRKIVKM